MTRRVRGGSGPITKEETSASIFDGVARPNSLEALRAQFSMICGVVYEQVLKEPYHHFSRESSTFYFTANSMNQPGDAMVTMNFGFVHEGKLVKEAAVTCPFSSTFLQSYAVQKIMQEHPELEWDHVLVDDKHNTEGADERAAQFGERYRWSWLDPKSRYENSINHYLAHKSEEPSLQSLQDLVAEWQKLSHVPHRQFLREDINDHEDSRLPADRQKAAEWRAQMAAGELMSDEEHNKAMGKMRDRFMGPFFQRFTYVELRDPPSAPAP